MKKHNLELLLTDLMEMCFEANAENPKLFMFQQLSKQLNGNGVNDQSDSKDSDEEMDASTSADTSDDSRVVRDQSGSGSDDHFPGTSSAVASTPLSRDMSTPINLIDSSDDGLATDSDGNSSLVNAEENISADLDNVESPAGNTSKAATSGDSSGSEDTDMLRVDNTGEVGRKSLHSPYYVYQTTTDDEEETE